MPIVFEREVISIMLPSMIFKNRNTLHRLFAALGVFVLTTVSFGVAQDRFISGRVTNRSFIIMTNGSSPTLLNVPKEWQSYLPAPATAPEIRWSAVGEKVGRGVPTAPRSVINLQRPRAEDSTACHPALRRAEFRALPGLYLVEPKRSYHLIDFRHTVSPGEL